VSDWINEEVWRDALKLQLNVLRGLKGYDRGSPEQIAKTRHRIDRIWNAGRPEWREQGMPSRLPG
jgi:hypothetical protein